MKNYKNSRLIKLLCGVLIALFIACNNQMEFDKEKWNFKHESDFPSYYRTRMLSDLITNHKFVGLPYSRVREQLGIPDKKQGNLMLYAIESDYGTDIDPVHTKDLIFTLSKDSIVTSFKVKEWNKK